MLALLLAAAASLSARQEERTVWDGVYTEEQAVRGGHRGGHAALRHHRVRLTEE